MVDFATTLWGVDPGSAATRPRFGILGPMEVFEHGQAVNPGSRKQQIVLAALLLHPNSTVSVEALVDALWPSQPPRTARKSIQVYVSTLRGLLGRGGYDPGISHQLAGYRLRVAADELDSLCFERKARIGQELLRSGQDALAVRPLAEALELWRGPVLDGLGDVPFLAAAARRLEARGLAVFEDWAEAEVAGGGGLAAIERITEVVQRHPYRERLRMVQMAALCQIGRRSEAMAVYDELRRLLAHEFGLAPGEAVATFYRSLLRDAQLPTSRTNLRAPRHRATSTLLPRDLPAFTGRRECTRQLVDALGSQGERLAVVTGPVGVGKTALAVHVGHQLGEAFPDGCFFIRLRSETGALRPLAEVFADLAWATALPDRHGGSADGRTLWQRWSAEHRALVVLDDVRSGSEIWPLLPETGPSAVLVTARPRLAGLESGSRLRVPLLSPVEALEFLGRIIGPSRVAADPWAAERIAAATGFLPLGLRVEADRLAWLRHVPLREHALREERIPALLDELTAGDVSVRWRVADAVADLPGSAKQALPLVASLDRCFTLGEAAAVLRLGFERTGRVLEALLEANVILAPDETTGADSVVYEMPVLIHEYARELAALRLTEDAASSAGSDPSD